jgi:putative tryptophan/tyrosine transport system substrate-binding protein
MKRREFIGLIGGAAASVPLAARAQQAVMPVIGYLSSVAEDASILAAFRRGLSEQGYEEGRNLRVEYRYAGGEYNRLPALAAELASLPVAVMVTFPSPAALAAKAATANIPITFALGVDPVELGLVASYNLPGGNVTGVTVIPTSLAPKRLELIDPLLPKTAPVGALINSINRPPSAELKLAEEAAQALGREFVVVQGSNEREIEVAFETLAQRGVGGLVVWQEAFLASRRQQIVALAQRHRLAAIYATRQFPEIGGLISYGSNPAESYRQLGVYVGKILKGARPADLPVMQPTTFELIINLRTAKTLGLEIPPTLLATADEVIE